MEFGTLFLGYFPLAEEVIEVRMIFFPRAGYTQNLLQGISALIQEVEFVFEPQKLQCIIFESQGIVHYGLQVFGFDARDDSLEEIFILVGEILQQVSCYFGDFLVADGDFVVHNTLLVIYFLLFGMSREAKIYLFRFICRINQ